MIVPVLIYFSTIPKKKQLRRKSSVLDILIKRICFYNIIKLFFWISKSTFFINMITLTYCNVKWHAARKIIRFSRLFHSDPLDQQKHTASILFWPTRIALKSLNVLKCLVIILFLYKIQIYFYTSSEKRRYNIHRVGISSHIYVPENIKK